MKENVAGLIEKSHYLSAKIVANGSAATATIAPSDMFGNYLNSNFIGFLSYAEWMKVVGCLWIILLTIEFCVKNTIIVANFIKSFFRK